MANNIAANSSYVRGITDTVPNSDLHAHRGVLGAIFNAALQQPPMTASPLTREISPGNSAIEPVAAAASTYQAFGSSFDGARLLAAALTGVETPSEDVISTIRRILAELDSIADNVYSVPVAEGDDEISLRQAAMDAGTQSALPPQARAAYVAGPDGTEGSILLADALSGDELEIAATEEVGQALARRAARKGIELAPGDVGARLRAALEGTFINPQNNPQAYEKKPLDGGDVLFAGRISEARFQPQDRMDIARQAFNQRRLPNSGFDTFAIEGDALDDRIEDGRITPQDGQNLLRALLATNLITRPPFPNLLTPFNVALNQQEFQDLLPANAFNFEVARIHNSRNNLPLDSEVGEQQLAETYAWLGIQDIGFLDGRYWVTNFQEVLRDVPRVTANGQEIFETDPLEQGQEVDVLPVQQQNGQNGAVFDRISGILQNAAFNPQGGADADDVFIQIQDVEANENANGPISNLVGGLYFNAQGVEFIRENEDVGDQPRPNFIQMGYVADAGTESDASDQTAVNAPSSSSSASSQGSCPVNQNSNNC